MAVTSLTVEQYEQLLGEDGAKVRDAIGRLKRARDREQQTLAALNQAQATYDAAVAEATDAQTAVESFARFVIDALTQ